MRNIFIIVPVVLIFIFVASGYSQPSQLARPTPQQLAFQNLELGVFIHYSIDVYAEPNTPSGTIPASAFNPTKLNVEQWVRAAKAMGAKYVVLTARHEQGFCLWPTKTTDYSIKSTPYKNGDGDIVKEFVNACRKYGLIPGLYTAPWIDAHWEIKNGVTSEGFGDINKLNDEDLYKKALEKEKTQIKELLSNYGQQVFVWNDHFGRSDALGGKPLSGKLRTFYAAFTSYAHELQPNCLFLGRDIEHVANEEGKACYPLWNALNTLDGTTYTTSDTYQWNGCNTGNPTGRFYRPQLAPTTVALSEGGWMWSGERKSEPLGRTMQAYYETIGQGANLIVNLTPDRRGLVPDNLVVAAKAFGDEIKRRFSKPITSSNSKEPMQVIKFDQPIKFNHVVTMEDLQDGQKIAQYTIEAEINGQWKTIVEGKTIGHKRIDQFEPVTATALRFTVTKSIVQPAVMRSVAVFMVSSNNSK